MDEVYSQLVQDEIALEEKNAQLEQSQQFILGLLSSMSDVLAACNARGEVEETNAAMCELLGQPDSVLRGSRFESWLADDASVTALRAVTASGTPAQGTVVELNMRDRQGAAVPVDFSCTPRGGRAAAGSATCWWAARRASSNARIGSCAKRTTRSSTRNSNCFTRRKWRRSGVWSPASRTS
jgi:PAS domain-containing protein